MQACLIHSSWHLASRKRNNAFRVNYCVKACEVKVRINWLNVMKRSESVINEIFIDFNRHYPSPECMKHKNYFTKPTETILHNSLQLWAAAQKN